MLVPARLCACRQDTLNNRVQSWCSLPGCAARWRQTLHSSHLLSRVRGASGSRFPRMKDPGKWKCNGKWKVEMEMQWSSTRSKMLLAASSVVPLPSEDKIPGFSFISLAVEMLAWCCCLSRCIFQDTRVPQCHLCWPYCRSVTSCGHRKLSPKCVPLSG